MGQIRWRNLAAVCVVGTMATALVTRPCAAQDKEPSEPPADQPAEPQPEEKPAPTAPVANPEDAPALMPLAPEPAPPAAAPDPLPADPGRELFAQAVEAVKRATAISYRARAFAEGKIALHLPTRIQADVRAVRNPEGVYPPWLVRSTGSGVARAIEGDAAFDVAWRAQTIEWVDFKDKKVLERRTRDAKGPYYNIAISSKLDELLAQQPFSLELKGEQFLLEGRQEIGGVMCDVVLVIYEGGKTKARWALGVDDHLPRRKERIVESSIAGGSMILEIENLRVPEVSMPDQAHDLVRVDVPEGFTEDRVEILAPTPKSEPVTSDAGNSEVKGDEKGGTTPDVKEAAPDAADATPANDPPAAPATPARPTMTHGPQFELATPAGEKVSLSSLKDNVVVLEFAGSWCLACRDAHTELDQLQRDFAGKPVKIFMLAVREKDPANAAADLATNNRTFGLLVNADAAAKAYGVKTFPSYFVLGFEGELVKHESSYAKAATVPSLKTVIEEYLATKGGEPVTPEPAKPPEPEEPKR